MLSLVDLVRGFLNHSLDLAFVTSTYSGTALKRCKSANCTVNLRTFIGTRVLTLLLEGMKKMHKSPLLILKM